VSRPKLEPSNDDIPADEMLLAKMLQNANARDLKAARGYFFVDADDRPCDVNEAAACCAIGACQLELDTDVERRDFSLLATGNDTVSYWTDFVPDNTLSFSDGETLGHAFQVSMEPE
jgi:hypothetical protein